MKLEQILRYTDGPEQSEYKLYYNNTPNEYTLSSCKTCETVKTQIEQNQH